MCSWWWSWQRGQKVPTGGSKRVWLGQRFWRPWTTPWQLHQQRPWGWWGGKGAPGWQWVPHLGRGAWPREGGGQFQQEQHRQGNQTRKDSPLNREPHRGQERRREGAATTAAGGGGSRGRGGVGKGQQKGCVGQQHKGLGQESKGKGQQKGCVGQQQKGMGQQPKGKGQQWGWRGRGRAAPRAGGSAPVGTAPRYSPSPVPTKLFQVGPSMSRVDARGNASLEGARCSEPAPRDAPRPNYTPNLAFGHPKGFQTGSSTTQSNQKVGPSWQGWQFVKSGGRRPTGQQSWQPKGQGTQSGRGATPAASPPLAAAAATAQQQHQ